MAIYIHRAGLVWLVAMTKAPLENEITAILSDCAARLMEAFRAHLAAAMGLSADEKQAKAGPDRPQITGRTRRKPAEIEADARRVADFVRGHPKGVRVTPIGAELSTTSDRLLAPIALAILRGWIKRKGERRATTYYPGRL